MSKFRKKSSNLIEFYFWRKFQPRRVDVQFTRRPGVSSEVAENGRVRWRIQQEDSDTGR